jgi:hypothetical protein
MNLAVDGALELTSQTEKPVKADAGKGKGKGKTLTFSTRRTATGRRSPGSSPKNSLADDDDDDDGEDSNSENCFSLADCPPDMRLKMRRIVYEARVALIEKGVVPPSEGDFHPDWRVGGTRTLTMAEKLAAAAAGVATESHHAKDHDKEDRPVKESMPPEFLEMIGSVGEEITRLADTIGASASSTAASGEGASPEDVKLISELARRLLPAIKEVTFVIELISKTIAALAQVTNKPRGEFFNVIANRGAILLDALSLFDDSARARKIAAETSVTGALKNAREVAAEAAADAMLDHCFENVAAAFVRIATATTAAKELPHFLDAAASRLGSIAKSLGGVDAPSRMYAVHEAHLQISRGSGNILCATLDACDTAKAELEAKNLALKRAGALGAANVSSTVHRPHSAAAATSRSRPGSAAKSALGASAKAPQINANFGLVPRWGGGDRSATPRPQRPGSAASTLSSSLRPALSLQANASSASARAPAAAAAAAAAAGPSTVSLEELATAEAALDSASRLASAAALATLDDKQAAGIPPRRPLTARSRVRHRDAVGHRPVTPPNVRAALSGSAGALIDLISHAHTADGTAEPVQTESAQADARHAAADREEQRLQTLARVYAQGVGSRKTLIRVRSASRARAAAAAAASTISGSTIAAPASESQTQKKSAAAPFAAYQSFTAAPPSRAEGPSKVSIRSQRPSSAASQSSRSRPSSANSGTVTATLPIADATWASGDAASLAFMSHYHTAFSARRKIDDSMLGDDDERATLSVGAEAPQAPLFVHDETSVAPLIAVAVPALRPPLVSSLRGARKIPRVVVPGAGLSQTGSESARPMSAAAPSPAAAPSSKSSSSGARPSSARPASSGSYRRYERKPASAADPTKQFAIAAMPGLNYPTLDYIDAASLAAAASSIPTIVGSSSVGTASIDASMSLSLMAGGGSTMGGVDASQQGRGGVLYGGSKLIGGSTSLPDAESETFTQDLS